MASRVHAQTVRRWLGVGIAVGLVMLAVMPVGAQSAGQPRLNEPVFRGQANSTNATTSLQGSVTGGASLVLDNQAAGQPALELVVASGAPFVVNSSTRVALLNADLLDGRHATSFALKNHNHSGVYLAVGARAANSNKLDGLDSTAFSLATHDHDSTYLGIAAAAADSSLLDGLNSTAFSRANHNHDADYLGIGATAADAALLDGLDSTAFAALDHTHVFSSLTGIPAGLADGDDDTLGSLACAAGQIPKRNLAGSGWICADEQSLTDAETLDGLDSLAFSLTGHNHNASYLGIGATAADSTLLDGLDSTAFSLTGHNHDASYVSVVGTPTAGNFPTLTAGGELANSAWNSASFALAGHNHDLAYLAIDGTAANCSLLDGLDSTAFSVTGHNHNASYLGIGATAADSSLLDGLDSTAFSLTGHNHNASYLGITATAADSDQVDGLDANELLRAASGATGDAPDANGDAVTASITAPQAGFLVISGSLEASGASDDFGCRLTVDAGAVTASDRNTSLQSLTICSTDGMVPVGAGAHTVALVTFGWDTAAFGNATVWVMFVPFGATG